MSNIAIKVDHVSKTFKLPHEKSTSIKGALINFRKKNRSYEKQQVLQDVSFEIKQGEFFGIVGRNGSGKSTLLKLLAGIYTPDKGDIQINGKLTPFIELGVGFNPELTGRENVYLNGALLGFDRKEMEAMYDDIVDFAELERFMDQKLKNYSSGMQVRLAFSIAIRAKSDILLIDEVLAVGDAAFQTKCFDYFYDLKKTGTTVVFVSHDRTSLERFCDRGVLVDKGEIITAGKIQKVLKDYSSIVLEELGSEKHALADAVEAVAPEYATIKNVVVMNDQGKKVERVTYGEKLKVCFEVEAKRKLTNPILGVTVWQRNVNKAVFAVNTLIEGIKETGVFEAGSVIKFESALPDLLNDGEYYIDPAVANASGTVFYDQKQNALTFYINGSNNPHSLISKENTVRIRRAR